jgi:3-phosphoshikimate 1-carboxyvinyltransferase
MRITGTPKLRGITYDLPVASAQVKSAVLLAGLYADGATTVIERKPTRNYTETMVAAFGGNVSVNGQEIQVERSSLKGRDVVVPGDISSAAFFMVAAAINPGASITIRNVGINPTRTGIVDALRLMGARVELSDRRSSGGEEVADITVTGAELSGIELDADIAPRMIDEFPVFFIAAAFANGTTVVRGAEELRVKESDRIETMLVGLRQLGVVVESKPDGAVISGVGSRMLKGGVSIETAYDHRIGMAFAIASSRCEDGITVVDAEAIGTSFPGFGDLCAGCGLASSQ